MRQISSATSSSLYPCHAGLKNILRGCLLAFLATFAGCFLFFTLPDLVASQLNKQLPYWFYANEVRLKSACSICIYDACANWTHDCCYSGCSFLYCFAAESVAMRWHNLVQLSDDCFLPVTNINIRNQQRLCCTAASICWFITLVNFSSALWGPGCIISI